MNLGIATLLAKRFLEDVVEGELLNKLTLVLDAAKSEDPDVLKVTAREALEAGKKSLFHDAALKVFPEYKKLGLNNFLEEEKLSLIEKLSENGAKEDEKLSEEEIADISKIITDESDNLKELSQELEKLTALADYFKVEEHKPFEAPAVSVFKFLEEAQSKSVDSFIDQMQLFQSLLSYCESETNKSENNIRMISGENPVIVADMSHKGAQKLQSIVALVRQTHEAYEEVEKTEKKLATFNVRSELLTALKAEANLIKTFKADLAKTFFDNNFLADEKEKVRQLSSNLLNLFANGAQIDALILQEEENEKQEQLAETLVDETSVFDFEGAEKSLIKEDAALATPFRSEETSEKQVEDFSNKKNDAEKPQSGKITFYQESAHSAEQKLNGSTTAAKGDEASMEGVTKAEVVAKSPLKSLWQSLLKK